MRYFLAGFAAYAAALTFVVSLCRAAARGDRLAAQAHRRRQS